MSDAGRDELTEEERLSFSIDSYAWEIALNCRRLRELKAPADADAVERAVNTLMTEFWDQGFSQTEIRHALIAAATDLNRYAGGEECNGDGLPWQGAGDN
jgi:hypothetical protein